MRLILPPCAPGMRIGLYGGSFNPAHLGHRHVTLSALRRLGLDRVWWLVSPGNPLKNRSSLPSVEERCGQARRIARHPRIAVTGFEAALGVRFTVQTLRFLTRRYPGVHFVWIMGADSLATFHRWKGFAEIAQLMPIAVIDRPGFTMTPLSARAARRLAGARIPEEAVSTLALRPPPAWVFLHGPRSPLSSTQIRARIGPGTPQLPPARLQSTPDTANFIESRNARWRSAAERGTRTLPEISRTEMIRPPVQAPGEAGQARSDDLKALALECLDDMKAEETIAIDLAGKTSLADTMIIASGRSQRHVGSIADKIIQEMKNRGFGNARVEGMPACDWVLIDAGDVLVHIFRPEVRGFYNLEKMWGADRPVGIAAG